MMLKSLKRELNFNLKQLVDEASEYRRQLNASVKSHFYGNSSLLVL